MPMPRKPVLIVAAALALGVGLVTLRPDWLNVSANDVPLPDGEEPAVTQPLSADTVAEQAEEAARRQPEKIEAEYHVAPSMKQGEVLKVTIDAPPESFKEGAVWMSGKKVNVYEERPGHFIAMMSWDVFKKPGAYPLKIQDRSGKTQYEQMVAVVDGHYPVQNIAVSKQMGGLKPLPGEMEAIDALKMRVTPERYWEEPFITPTPHCQNSPFGVKRAYNGKLSDNYHKGVDIRSGMGTPIKATTGGKVVMVKPFRLHGNTIGIDHGQGVNSIYIHMSRFNVKEGDIVKKGDVIGYVGSTGFANGPHLHWGLYVNGVPVNPNQFVKGVPRC
ncbi:MAG: M23 family metallopeptidase [Candidatus Melainabacteria bacterium]